MNRHGSVLSLFWFTLATGCGASTLPPHAAFPGSEEIRTAEAYGASRTPRAALHLGYAKDQVAEANRLWREGDEIDARLAFMRATADASLSLELTHEAKAQADAADVHARTLGRGTPTAATASTSVDVAEAREALTVAERSFEADHGSLTDRTYSYLALRGAERSVARAGMLMAQQEAAAGQKWLLRAASQEHSRGPAKGRDCPEPEAK